ncbi:MAG: Sir2 family NAD-dependent protein deacetylase [Myxococcales bacterium]|nr:NAD-dependent protein deacetylase [Polyangiaceae bacterium]MDW8249241.1 Sir2 family NAD-dependent protein deacetylase [Myxococcales bacterium]
MSEDLGRVAEALREAEGLVVTAGAGMGVDSGLPDFRGNQGFWRAYPPYAKLGLGFSNVANPRWFQEDPRLAWGFYGHRLELYRRTVPHAGFRLLRQWGENMRLGAFVFTSNVDGQFQRAGFDPERIYECHGAIDFLQCLAECGVGIFPADGVSVEVDEETFRAKEPLPSCPRCGSIARPNILMFGDGGWDDTRADAQEVRLSRWLERARGAKLVVIECGAGTAIPSVRIFGERLVGNFPGALLVRINPREPNVPQGHVGIASGALAALQAIEALR